MCGDKTFLRKLFCCSFVFNRNLFVRQGCEGARTGTGTGPHVTGASPRWGDNKTLLRTFCQQFMLPHFGPHKNLHFRGVYLPSALCFAFYSRFCF